MQELVGLAHRGNKVMDPHKSWLPLLQCLLKLNSHGTTQTCAIVAHILDLKVKEVLVLQVRETV